MRRRREARRLPRRAVQQPGEVLQRPLAPRRPRSSSPPGSAPCGAGRRRPRSPGRACRRRRRGAAGARGSAPSAAAGQCRAAHPRPAAPQHGAVEEHMLGLGGGEGGEVVAARRQARPPRPWRRGPGRRRTPASSSRSRTATPPGRCRRSSGSCGWWRPCARRTPRAPGAASEHGDAGRGQGVQRAAQLEQVEPRRAATG